MQIETKRLIINKFDASDIDAWALIESDPKVREFVDNKALTFSEAKSYVLENIESYKINGYGRYAVWSCPAYVPVPQLIYAAFRSKAKGLLPPSDEWRRRGL